MKTVIVDYESGNLHSAQKAFEKIAGQRANATVVVTADPDVIAKADRIVLPGDGAFPACRAALFDHRGVFEAIETAVITNARPFLGICIGMQMMATKGMEYAPTQGFNWIGGTVERIAPATADLKIPHMGWNDLIIDHPHPVFNGINTGDHAYFVHSYHMHVDQDAHRLAHVDYAQDVTAIIGRDNLLGMQFHPEKSAQTGLKLIDNFLAWAP